jgi:uncharacterized protein
MNVAKLYQHRATWIYLPVILLTGLAFLWISQVALPLPPQTVTISAGRPGGMYQVHAAAYRASLDARGISLEVLESAGTGENLQRLKDPNNSVQIALAQSGYSLGDISQVTSIGIQTIAHVDIEPIWVFSRFRDVDSLLRLQGQRVAMGQQGSGSREVALRLLSQVRLEAKDLLESELVGLNTVAALREGKIDATIFVASVNAPVVQAHLSAPGVYLANLKRSAALSERMPYLDARFAATGSLNASRLQPSQDMVLLSTMASILVREDLHPMIKRALMHAALQHHSAAGPMHRSNEFPHLKRLEFPSTPQSREVLRDGLPWFEQHLPLRWAQWMYRLIFVGLPLTLLAWLFCKLAPAYLSWRIDSRINRWYGELKFIENDLNQGQPRGLELAQFRTRLKGIAKQVSVYPLPKNYMQRLFVLQQHIALVDSKMQSRLGR